MISAIITWPSNASNVQCYLMNTTNTMMSLFVIALLIIQYITIKNVDNIS